MQKTDDMRKNLSDATLSGRMALDGSVLVELLAGSEIGSMLTKALLEEKFTAYTCMVNIAEAEYILCRKVGRQETRGAVEALVESGYIAIEEDRAIHVIASGLKCDRAISLADCYTFAVAEVTSSRPVFACKEQEVMREMAKRPFDVEPIFLT